MTTAPGFLGVLQWIGIVLAGLGLSGGPWVVATLAGKLVPLRAHLERLNDLKEQRDNALKAAERQEVRADAAIQALSDLANEQGATTVKLLQSLPVGGGDRRGSLPPSPDSGTH